MADRLKGKVALVVVAGSSGPGWGNGKATAVAFAREGARVFCADVNAAAAEETAGIIKGEGGEALAHRADVSRAADVAAMAEACAAAYGRIDVLDNNVGIADCGACATSRCRWDLAAMPGTSPGRRFILPATRAAMSPASSSWSTAASRSNMSEPKRSSI